MVDNGAYLLLLECQWLTAAAAAAVNGCCHRLGLKLELLLMIWCIGVVLPVNYKVLVPVQELDQQLCSFE